MKQSKVKQIWNDISKSQCTPGIDRLNLKHIKSKKFDEKYVKSVYEAINGRTPYVFTKYKQILKTKGRDKKPRVISIPTIRDRLMLQTLKQELNFIKRPSIDNLVNSINDGIISNKYDKFIKFDIKNFYDQIDIETLIGLLTPRLETHILRIIESALMTNTVDEKSNTRSTPKLKLKKLGVPQGIIISNSLAEFYLKDFDKYFLKFKNIKFIRFVDDILILFNSKKISKTIIKNEVITKLAEFKLRLNGPKTRDGYLHQPFNFIGYNFFTGDISPKRDAILLEEKKIERIILDIKNCSNSRMNKKELLEWKLMIHARGFTYKKKVYGWVQVYKNTTNITVFYKLDWLVKKLLIRYGYYKSIKTYSFAKSFNYLHNNNNSFAVNFDTEYKTVSSKKKLLHTLFNLPKSIKADVVEGLFNSLVKKTIFDVERDLDFKYSIN